MTEAQLVELLIRAVETGHDRQVVELTARLGELLEARLTALTVLRASAIGRMAVAN